MATAARVTPAMALSGTRISARFGKACSSAVLEPRSLACARPRVSGTRISARRFGKACSSAVAKHPKPTTRVRLRGLTARVSVKTFATENENNDGPETGDGPESEEQKKQPKDGEKPATFRGVDITGGRYGMGEGIDKGLDATTNPDLFLVGFVSLCSFAILAFLFGPKPPSDYYG
jgi:hypothetical protein